MIGTAFWIGWLSLRRDKAAFLMTFVLPPVLFLALAAVFSNAPGRDLKLKLVVADLVHTPASRRLADALDGARSLRTILLEQGTAADVAELVRRGTGDAGLVIRTDPAVRSDVPPLLVVQAPARPLAAAMALGQIQRIVSERMPDVLLRRILDDLQATDAIDADDRAFLDKAFAKQAGSRAEQRLGFSRLGAIEPLASPGAGGDGGTLQYAAAVSAIFLLFGAVQGAYVLIDERENGLADRVRLAAGGGMAGALAGRLLFLVAQGVTQVALVYLTALAVHGAGFPPSLLPAWLAVCLAAAAACAGLALLACALSRTRRQAELWTTFAVLLVSMLGGSMVPRYLMPAWLQSASWWTPNAWIIHGLEQSTLVGSDPLGLLRTIGVLGAIALATFGLAVAAA